ncbi:MULTISPECIES: acyl-CoA dehydrogenase family protein [Pseudomonas]|uniref:3-sulfinopropanoyl-CoA desulfinase n=1 Tax=Pseudomonas hunanensis TaxID=1247546 RepID=A0ABD6N4V1_9PSED|nr:MULTISPECIES: acyl-CoA dehydrogenase family protein [Pseudomonas]MDH4846238.1 acyl-CoA dehydrogenase [Pseudomonas sp. BN605]MDH4858527.1 acyl-CoA dehydrogenase [Pseudomonas sp. BN505]NWL07993.1 acyl-CoA dehydrogenase [Pseudomonas hunanensis]NWL45127.1 acyl-CoA dehydrogenase [Pseudomonas hunanensis]
MTAIQNNTAKKTAGPTRQQPRMYHDLMTPAEALGIREEVRAFCEKHVAPVAWDIGHREESVEAFPRVLFKQMADAGLFRIPFAAEVGGRGLKHRATATAIVIEELSYFSNSVAAIYDVHCILAGHALEWASEELQARYLAPLLAGEKIGSFATSEPLASTDLSVDALVTDATFHEDHIEINGHKRWITNSPVASFVVLLCRDGERMTEVVVDLDAAGVTVGAPDKKLGNHGQLTADIVFNQVRVPLSNVVGDRGDGLKIALQVLTYGRIGIAASGVGMAQSVFDHSVDRLKSRRVFGKPLGAQQHWQFRLAERAMSIENARNLYLKASLRMDDGVLFPEPEAAMAKWYATNLASEFAREGIQIFGGYGFTKELAHDGSRYHVEEVYRDCKIAEIYEGANEVQMWVIARSIFGKEITG